MFGNQSEKYDYTEIIAELEKDKIDTKKLSEFLSAENFKINACIDEQTKSTLLHRVIKKNKLVAVKWLLENQANPYNEDEHSLPAFFYFVHSLISKKLYFLFDENNVDFNYKNSQGRIVLQDIVINGDIALYNRVEPKIKKPFTLDNYGKNLLFDAISSGDKDTMNLVFDHEQAELDIQDNNKDSLLHFVKDGDLNLIEYLLEKGVPPTLQDIHEKNIIFYLSERAEKTSSELDLKQLTALIELALKSKESQEQKDKDGNNLLTGFLKNLHQPLSKYTQKDFLSQLITKFIDNGVKIDEKNKEGENALLVAVAKNDVETVSILVEKGADINIKNEDDITPLYLAIMKGTNEYFDMVELLISCSANPNITDSKNISIVEKVIYILIYLNKKSKWQKNFCSKVLTSEDSDDTISKFDEDDYMRNIFELLISKKMIDCKMLDSLGNPFFYMLLITENYYLADLLFKCGSNINQLNKNNQNILQYYLEFITKHKIENATILDTIKHLIRLGVDLDYRDLLGATVLHNTILQNSLSITRSIISAGGTVDAVDKKGRTLLHNAIWSNDIAKLKCILSVKPELINVPDKLGVIAINYAAFLGNQEFVLYLIGHNSFVNNLHEKKKSTLDFFKRFHKNIFELEHADYYNPKDKADVIVLLKNMKEEFNIVE